MLIVDGSLVPTCRHTVAASNKNYRYATTRQVMIDAATRLVVTVGQPPPGNRNDGIADTSSKTHPAADRAAVLADGATTTPAS